MKPIMQTDFTFESGNCMQACVASIFELPLDQVPNFNREGPDHYNTFISDWASEFNMIALDIALTDDTLTLFKDTHMIAIGDSPRSPNYVHSTSGPEEFQIHHNHQKHACIYLNNEIVHDPHPDGTGIYLPQDFFTVFIIKDPSLYNAVSHQQIASMRKVCNCQEPVIQEATGQCALCCGFKKKKEDTMNKFELIERLNDILCGDLPIVVRGEKVIADISDVYIDYDHGDEHPFISIDLENEL